MYFIGIDGGGTHTRVELRDGENRFLRRMEFGAFNMASIGETAFRQRLQEIFAAIGDLSGAAALCVGGAGSSGSPMEAVLREELETAGFRGKLRLCGDHEIALTGAMDGPGCVLIAGTGAICCGKDAAGNFARSGGWGHIADDGGSAYAIGIAAISAALKTEDGRLPENALHSAVMEALHLSCPEEIVRFLHYGNTGKAEIAALAPLVISCASVGDAVSREILERQSRELAALAEAVISRLHLQRPKLALLGGLLETESLYKELVCSRLSTFAELTQPAHTPVWGAAQLAWESCR